MVNKGDAAHNEINSFQSKAAKYKREGDAHFGKRNMSEALASYGKAIEMSLSGTEEKAALFSNRAACYLMQNMYRHAVAECSVSFSASIVAYLAGCHTRKGSP